jgi:D-glycero-D-manno-heptose 1,7-bisphosphate phosphatase
MWSILRREFGLRADQSLMVGDKMSDVGFGKNAGLAATVLLLTGHGTSEARAMGLPEPDGPWWERDEFSPREWPEVVARDLEAFCAWLLQG